MCKISFTMLNGACNLHSKYIKHNHLCYFCIILLKLRNSELMYN